MKSFIKFFACGIMCFIFSSAFTQNDSLSTSLVILPDTSTLGDTDSTVKITVTNISSSPYSGYVNVYYSTDTIVFSSFMFCSIPSVFLNPGDTFQLNCNITFDSTNFNTGNNIVVVWSSGNAIAPADSIRDNIYLKTLSGIHETSITSSFTIFPTLAKDFIMIESSENILPKKIFIEDVTGRIISIITPSTDSKNRIKINTADLNSGIYFLDILLPGKQRVVSKFVKTD